MQKLTLPQHEIIVSSAIQLHDGSVYTGMRHGDCFDSIMKFCTNRDRNKKEEQGFITSRLRFVSREEAARIAYKERQIHAYKPVLYSEDIFIGKVA